MKEPTMKEILELVEFGRDAEGDLFVRNVKGNVEGDVDGNVYGDIKGSVIGDVECNVWGTVWGKISGRLWHLNVLEGDDV